MTNIDRDDIQIISRHSNWSEDGIDTTLKQEVYNDKASWQKFLRLFFISLGVGFTTAGVLFFFAYNWADLHKFVKIGLIESLIVITTLIILFSKISEDIKKIMLTGASVLVGVLFAVFGQIYQTGANAYDFFLGWTLFIVLWVIISDFAPLWLLLIILINTTILLYAEQVAYQWSDVFTYSLLFYINSLILVMALIGKNRVEGMKPPIWLNNIIALAAICYSTLGLSIGILDEPNLSFLALLLISGLCYGAGIWYGLKVKSGFYLSIIPFSIIIIICSLLVKISNGAAMFLMISFFVIVSVSLVIKYLINLQKKWIN